MVRLFQRVRGFYLKSEGEALPEAVGTWDVRVLKISLSKPFTVQKAQIYFWEELYQHLTRKQII